MQIMIGDTNNKKHIEVIKRHKISRMTAQPRLIKPYPGELWGFDNGAYGLWKKGKELPPPSCESGELIGLFLTRINRALSLLPQPYLAVLPDIVGGGDRSLELSLSWIGHLPPHWKWYLAVQDGMTVAKVIDKIHLVDGIFLGGTNEYKKFAGYWCKIAHHHKKKFHYARCGTIAKMAHAVIVGADSIDSTYPVYEKGRLFAFIQQLSQQTMEGLNIFAPHPEHGGLVDL